MVLPLRAALLPTTFDSLGLSNLSSSSITSVGTDSLRKNPQVLRNRLPVVRNRLPSTEDDYARPEDDYARPEDFCEVNQFQLM